MWNCFWIGGEYKKKDAKACKHLHCPRRKVAPAVCGDMMRNCLFGGRSGVLSGRITETFGREHKNRTGVQLQFRFGGVVRSRGTRHGAAILHRSHVHHVSPPTFPLFQHSQICSCNFELALQNWKSGSSGATYSGATI